MTDSPLILVVDDDPDTRSMVKTILENSSFKVAEAENGRIALEQIEKLQPSLILLDINMPEMNGYDVVIHLKQKPDTQNIPVIMLTAKSEPEDLIAGYKDYAAEYYITKPFTTRQLLAGIKLVLG
jgi:two-component system alkaline phosphatase synthesis response regulator PhoP